MKNNKGVSTNSPQNRKKTSLLQRTFLAAAIGLGAIGFFGNPPDVRAASDFSVSASPETQQESFVINGTTVALDPAATPQSLDKALSRLSETKNGAHNVSTFMGQLDQTLNPDGFSSDKTLEALNRWIAFNKTPGESVLNGLSLWAAAQGYTESLNILINKGANKDIVNSAGLNLAVQNDNIETVQFLIETNKANLGLNNYAALGIAAAQGHTEMTAFILDHLKNTETPEAVSSAANNAFAEAAANNNFSMMSFLQKEGVVLDANIFDKVLYRTAENNKTARGVANAIGKLRVMLDGDEQTAPLRTITMLEEWLQQSTSDDKVILNGAALWTAAYGSADFIDKLVAKGLNPHDGAERLLNTAVFRNNEPIVKLLVERYNADIRTTIKIGDSSVYNDKPLQLAAEQGHLDVAQYLIEKGADPRSEKFFSLFLATRNNHMDMTKMLLSYMEEKDLMAEAETAINNGFVESAANGNLAMMKLLRTKGADASHNDYAALRSVVAGTDIEPVQQILDWLEEKGLIQEYKEEKDIEITYLQEALDLGKAEVIRTVAETGNVPILKLLLSYGADPELSNYKALEVAASFNQVDIAKELLDHAEKNNVGVRVLALAKAAAAATKNIEMQTLLDMALEKADNNKILFNMEEANLSLEKARAESGLQKAVASKDTATFSSLIDLLHEEKGAAFLNNLLTTTGIFPTASAYGTPEIVQKILETARTVGGDNSVRHLLDYAGMSDADGEPGYLATLLSAREGRTDTLKILLGEAQTVGGEDYKNKILNNGEYTLFKTAIEFEKLETASAIADLITPAILEKSDFSPLYWAANMSHPETVSILGKSLYKADGNKALTKMLTDRNYGAFQLASEKGHDGVVRELFTLAHSTGGKAMEIDMLASNNFQPFRSASEKGELSIVDMLAHKAHELGGNSLSQTQLASHDYEALRAASQGNQIKVVERLIEMGNKMGNDTLVKKMLAGKNYDAFLIVSKSGQAGLLGYFLEKCPDVPRGTLDTMWKLANQYKHGDVSGVLQRKGLAPKVQIQTTQDFVVAAHQGDKEAMHTISSQLRLASRQGDMEGAEQLMKKIQDVGGLPLQRQILTGIYPRSYFSAAIQSGHLSMAQKLIDWTHNASDSAFVDNMLSETLIVALKQLNPDTLKVFLDNTGNKEALYAKMQRLTTNMVLKNNHSIDRKERELTQDMWSRGAQKKRQTIEGMKQFNDKLQSIVKLAGNFLQKNTAAPTKTSYKPPQPGGV